MGVPQKKKFATKWKRLGNPAPHIHLHALSKLVKAFLYGINYSKFKFETRKGYFIMLSISETFILLCSSNQSKIFGS
jgi:hypothetical protein